MNLRPWMLAAAIFACRKEGPTADRAQTAAPEAAVPAEPVGSAAAGPATAPPGTDKLVNVPADIASKIELVEVVRGLARPVAIVAAPDDPRKRLFIVEQHAGRIRILENGKLAAKAFYEVDAKISLEVVASK